MKRYRLRIDDALTPDPTGPYIRHDDPAVVALIEALRSFIEANGLEAPL